MSREVRRKPHAFDGLDDVFQQPADPRIARDDFGRTLAVLVSAFPGRPLLPATAEIYYRALACQERDDVLSGVRDAVTTCEQWPSVATLRRLCYDARARRLEREGMANVPGQPVSAERAALIAELHEAEAAVARAAHGTPAEILAADERYQRVAAALRG